MECVLIACLLGAVSAPLFAQGDASEQELRSQIEDELEAWNRRDLAEISDGFARGFGFRTFVPRSSANFPPAMVRQVLVRFFESLERYEITVEELDVAVDGEIGLAWGIFVEDFQHKGSPPERIRVRFTMTLRKAEDGQWRTLLGHRDVQQFDDNGQYLRAYVRDQ